MVQSHPCCRITLPPNRKLVASLGFEPKQRDSKSRDLPINRQGKRKLVPSRGIEPRPTRLQRGVQPLHLQGMEENVRVELTYAFRRIIVFETITNRLVLFSKWRISRRIERPSIPARLRVQTGLPTIQ